MPAAPEPTDSPDARRFRRALLALALAIGAAACASDLIVMAGGVEARGDAGATPSRFSQIAFDVERSGAARIPVFCVRLSADSPPMRTDQLTPENVARVLPSWQPPPQLSESYYRSWPASDPGTHRLFMGNGYWISFRDDRLVAMVVTGASEPGAAPEHSANGSVGPASCERLHVLPLERGAFAEVFGKADSERTETHY